jgi:hypothetical protein
MMPIKKQPKVFMNHIVIHPDQKPVRPVVKPVLITATVPRNPYGIKFN